MKIRYFHGQYKTNVLGTNEISYIFDSWRMSKVGAHFQRKKNVHIFIQVSKQRN